MKEDLEYAEQYRKRARRLREKAKLSEYSARRVLLRIADDYEHLAQSRELIDELDRARRSRH